MNGLEDRVSTAVREFWLTRSNQVNSASIGGGRGAVVGGAQMAGFVNLVRDVLVDSGCPADAIHFTRGAVDLPGFFRATKQWDLVVVHRGCLLAAIEFKSQVGSFGNNFNNRTEEVLGNATDIWTAYREGAFPEVPRPWLGYLMLLQEAPGSTKPVSVSEPHFEVFPEFRDASYSKRYQLLCQRLLRERLYDGASFMLSTEDGGLRGEYSEPVPHLGFEIFTRALTAHVAAFCDDAD